MTPSVVAVVDPYSSGVMYAPALRRAGFRPVAVLSDPEPSAYFTSTFRPADFDLCLTARPGVGKLIEGLAPLAPVAVVPGSEIGVELADRLAAHLIPERANLPELAEARRHKGAMIEAVRAAGIPVARTLTTGSADEVAAWIAREDLAGADLVVKPAKSVATDGVTLVRAGQDWRPALAKVLGRVNAVGQVNAEAVVQERLIGTEFVIDTVSWAGGHSVTDICRYGKVEVGASFAVYDHVEFLPYDAPEHGQLISYVERVLDALGIRFGPAHTEVMLTEDGPRLIETNARLAGSGLPAAAALAVGETGVDRFVAGLRGEVDWPRGFDLTRSVMTMLFIAPRAGVATNVAAYRKIGALRTCRHLQVKIFEGDLVPATSDLMSSMTLGWAVLADRSADRVHADLARARSIAAEVRFLGNPRKSWERRG